MNNMWKNAESISMFFVPMAFIGGIMQHSILIAIFSPIFWFWVWKTVRNRNLRNGII
jgi:hypothetical protein